MSRLTLFGASFMIALLVIAGLSHAAIDSSTAMGIWLLDEGDGDTAFDSSGNGHHGKISGAAMGSGCVRFCVEF